MEKELKKKALKSLTEAPSAAEDRVALKQRGDSPILHYETAPTMLMA